MSTHRELFQAAKSGQNSEFLQLTQAYQTKLRNFIRGRLGSHLQKHVDANDILQETFVRALKAIERAEWRGDDALYSWFCGIASNIILDAERRFLRVKDLPDREQSADVTSPSRHLQRKERFSRLKESLSHLTDEQRQVIQLFRIEGLKVAEVARRMDRSEKATYQLLWRAMARLKQDFKETGSLHLPDERLNSEDGRGQAE